MLEVSAAATCRVVFVPGFMQRAGAWGQVATRVGERYPSVCLDHRTFSRDQRVEEIRRAVAPGGALAGYSLGGRLCLQLALQEPRRFRALVLVGASAGIEDVDERARRAQADQALAAWFEREAMPEIVHWWERQSIFANQSPDLLAAQRAERLDHSPKEIATLLRTAGQGSMEPVWSALPELEIPVLALAGALDRHYAFAAQRMAELLPDGRAELIPGAGHAPHLERADYVAALLLEFFDYACT